MTDERKHKISLSHIGKKASEETRKKLSQNSWVAKHTGKNHHNYNHSLTEKDRLIMKNRSVILGYYQWHQSILKHDNYTCQKCGSKNQLRVAGLDRRRAAGERNARSKAMTPTTTTTTARTCRAEHKQKGAPQ
jgi:hypothetical protein